MTNRDRFASAMKQLGERAASRFTMDDVFEMMDLRAELAQYHPDDVNSDYADRAERILASANSSRNPLFVKLDSEGSPIA